MLLNPQSKPKKLRVLARGTASVQDFEALGNGGPGSVNRFHGWKWVSYGPQYMIVDDLGKPTGRSTTAGHRVKQLGKVCEVPDTVEYRRALLCGDLWPADEATARAVGAKWDPSFGDEHGDKALAHLHEQMSDLECETAFRLAAHAVASEHLPESLRELPPDLKSAAPASEKA
jgi:hypothetical protein